MFEPEIKGNFECFFLFWYSAHVPKIPEEVLFHNVFQEEVTEMVDNPAVLKHLKQQVLRFFCTESCIWLSLWSMNISLTTLPPTI